MKKFCYYLAAAALAPAIIVSVANSALAQRRPKTSHDVPPAQVQENQNEASARIKTDKMTDNTPDCGCRGKKMHDKHKKIHDGRKDPKHHEWLRENREELEENYEEALAKIKSSDLTDAQKDLLIKQANENKDLMLRQLDERQKLMQTHMRQCQDNKFSMDNKADRKAVKKVRKILTD